MKYLKRDELKRLLNTVESLSPTNGSWQRLMFLTAFWHGLRVSEVNSLTGSNIRDGYLTVQRLKKSKKTTQPFVLNKDPELSEYEGLLALAEKAGPDEILFPMTRDGILKLMKRAGKIAGIPEHKCHPHALKHSIAMVMIKAKGIKEVQVYLGHVEGKNTMRYLDATEEEAASGLGALL